MKMPASETAPMAPTLIATRGLSGAVCAAAGESAIASAAKTRPTTRDGATGRNVMTAPLGCPSRGLASLILPYRRDPPALRRRLRLAGRDCRRGGGQRHLALVV